jgi:LysM repeat protein
MNKVQGALDKAQSFVDLAKRWQGKIYAGIAQLKGMLDQVNNMARYVVSAPMQLAQMAKAINNVAFTTWQQWKDIGKLAQRAWGSGDFWKHGWGWEATDAELLPQKPTHEDAGARTKLRVVQSILNAIAEQRRTLNNAALEAQRPFGIHIVSSGESLESIAIRYFGSLDGVSQLLSLNPNLKALPLRPGMQIKVPKSAEAMWQSRRDFPVTDKGYNAPSGDEDGRAGDAWFGEDLLGPDLKLAGEEGGICDLATIKGTDLVMQDCLIRLMTHKGTNVLYPQVGLSVSPGDLNDTTAVSMAVAEVWQNLVCDDRIAGVRSLDVVDNGNGITIEATVALVDRKEIGLQWRGT